MAESSAAAEGAIPRRGRDLALAVAMPLLLAAIAVLAIVRAATLDQSSWSGAGFGMFATVDNETSRFLVVYATDAAGTRRVALPHDLRDEAFEANVVPIEDRVERIANEVFARLASTGVTHVEVMVWGLAADDAGEGLEITAEVIVRSSTDRAG